MKNVSTRVEGTKLVIEVDLTQDFGESSTGKSILVATTAGNKPVPGHPGMQYGITVFKFPPKK